MTKEESRPEWIPGFVEIWGSRLDPSGNRALIVIETPEDTTEVLIVDEDGPVRACPVDSWVFDSHWSSDGRWVVMEVERRQEFDASSIWFLDPDTCLAIPVPSEEDPGFLAAVGS